MVIPKTSSFIFKLLFLGGCFLAAISVDCFKINSSLPQHNIYNYGLEVPEIYNNRKQNIFKAISHSRKIGRGHEVSSLLSPVAFVAPSYTASSSFEDTAMKSYGFSSSFGESGGTQKIKEGDNIPSCEWKVRKELPNGTFEWGTLKTDNIFEKNKLIVLFALPGAFTPTCSSYHLPKYEELFGELRKYGVEDVYCLSVNDSFVMNAWKKHQNVNNVKFVSDGSCVFTNMIGMGVQKDNIGFGRRSWRYSMLINDGKVEKIFEEEGMQDNADEDPFAVSDANTMLNYLINRKNVAF